jgi:hypothetical protein
MEVRRVGHFFPRVSTNGLILYRATNLQVNLATLLRAVNTDPEIIVVVWFIARWATTVY